MLKYFTSILIFIIIGCGLLFWGTDSMCGNEIYQEIFSPDNEYKAVVFQRDCGATTGFSTQISILRATDELPNNPGNVFIMEGYPDWTNVHVQWETNRSVVITYTDEGYYEIFRARNKWRDFFTVITIRYRNNSH